MEKPILTRLLDGLARRLPSVQPDLAFVGIGENGHLAFNDPPADFTTERPYLIVTLDEACRRQQVGEGWFASMDDVPAQAISMSVRQILKSKEIIAIVPDARKADRGESVRRGTRLTAGARVDPANASEHHFVSRSRFSCIAGAEHDDAMSTKTR